MEHLENQPHIGLSKKTAKPVAVVVGDPNRATSLAQMADCFKLESDKREYRVFSATFQGAEITIVSHGVGSAGAAVCFEELMKVGTETIIRVGTCGSLQPRKIQQADVVVCYACATHSKVAEIMAPEAYPSAADPHTHNALLAAAKEEFSSEPSRLHEGVGLSTDTYYPSPIQPDYLERFQKTNLDVVEMEAGVLFLLSRVRGAKAAAIFAVDGCPMEWDEGNFQNCPEKLQEAKEKMMKAALVTAARLTKREKS